MPTKRPPKIATPEFKKEVCRYALMDAKSSLAIFERYHMDWPDTEVEISRMTREMGMRGVPINVEKARAAEATLLAECERTKKLIPWADDAETSLLSLAAIRRQCEVEGIRAPVSFAEKSDDGSAWEEEFSDRFPWVSAVREYRKANKHLKTVQTMLSRVKPDGWMPYELKYFGAHSGRDSGASGWNCVTGDHEVLTPEGWVSIADWLPSTSIMQFMPDGSLEFCRAEKFEKPYSGPMISVEGARIRGMFTPDHRVISHRRGTLSALPARLLLEKRVGFIPLAGNFHHAKSDRTDSELRLLVALAAAGHETSKDAVVLGFKKHRKIERLKSLLDDTNLPYSVVWRPDGVASFTIQKYDRPYWLKKGLGPWLLDLSPEQASLVIQELAHWDGFFHYKNGAVNFSTTVLDEALWVATLGHLHGSACSVNEYRRKDGKSPRYLTYFTSAKTTEIRPRHIGTMKVEEVQFSGKVYCPTVPSGAFLVRYRNRIHVTGNCQNIPKGIVAGVDIRSLIEAPEYKTLVICDLSQIEPRVLAWLAEDTAMLDYIRGCADLYEAQARAWGMWNKPEELRTDPATRHVIKTLNIGLGYQMGAARFSASAGVSTAEAERLVGLYRSKNTKICGRGGFWEMLGRKISFATSRPDKTLRIHLPSGRTCIYRDVCRKGGDITCLLPGKSGKFERRKMFPGGICENLTQAVARDIFMSRCLLLREQGYEILMRVHDEAVILVDEDSASDDAKVIESIMSTPPAWCDDLPMGAESKVSKFYTK
jgi:hypothetical protein